MRQVASITASYPQTEEMVKAIAAVNLGEGSDLTKRLRGENGDAIEMQQPPREPQGPEKSTEEQATVKAPKKQGSSLAPITGMVNPKGDVEPPKDMRQVLAATKPEMSMLDLLAWSHSVCREIKRLATRKATKSPKKQVRKKKVKKPQTKNLETTTADGREFVVGMVAVVTKDAHATGMRNIGLEDQAFKLLVTVELPFLGKTNLNRTITQADQGSDLNISGQSLAVKLGLEMQSLAEVGFEGMAMRVASGQLTTFSEFAKFTLGVEGIWRTIYIVSPCLNQQRTCCRTPKSTFGWAYHGCIRSMPL